MKGGKGVEVCEERLVKKYIKTITLCDIFDGISLVYVIDNLMGEYKKLLEDYPEYIRFEYITDFENSVGIDIYGYREETDEEKLLYNNQLKRKQDRDWNMWLELNKKFKDLLEAE
jgi:hypothetical protein